MTRKWVVAGLAVSAALLALLLLREDGPPSGEAASLVAPRGAPAEVPEFDVPHEAAAPAATDVHELQPLVVDDAHAADADALVTFVVHHADGAPARACMVAVATGNKKVAWSALTDETGTVRGAVVEGPVTAWVGGATHVPAPFPIAEARGRHELVLPAGEVIDGWVVIDGSAPTEPIPLGLESDDDSLEAVPWFVRDALAPRVPGLARSVDLGAFVAADGAFRFSGLPAGWTGRFMPPYIYWNDDLHALDARAPEHGRVLELHRVPHIRFRIVSPGERAPVPFAQGMVIVLGAANSSGYGLNCDADGRAAVPMLHWEQTLAVQLDYADPAGLSRVQARFDVTDAAHDLDLGDIELTSRWSIPFRVSAPDGTPIAGAIGATECETSLRSAPTDATGFARLDGVPPGCAELRVGAERHEPARVTLPPQPTAEPIAVTLVPCASLNLLVSSADGEPRPGLWLLLRTERHVSAADEASAFHETALRLGVHVADGQGTTGRQARTQPDGSVLQARSASWQLRTLGECALGCQEPGAPVRLDLVDGSRFVLWSDEVRLEAGEQRRLEAVLTARPQSLDVLVSDETGAPLPGVTVRVRSSTGAADFPVGFAGGETTEEAGRVQFENLYAPALDVACEKSGYTPSSLAAVAPGSLAQVVLSRGLAVTLHCTDAQGHPARVDGAWIGEKPQRAGDRIDVVVDEDGLLAACATWRFVGLQPGPQTIAVDAGGRRFTLEHDASVPDATLVVPEFGGLVVTGLHAAKGQASSTLHVRPDGAGEGALSRSLNLGHIARDQVTWPLVFAGRYVVELRAGDRVLANPATVEVRAGETVQVELH